jgi:hypothetical protein
MVWPHPARDRRWPCASASVLCLLSALLLPGLSLADDPTADWRTIETPHFYVHYYRNMRHSEQEVAQKVARAAEAAHAVLAPALRHVPSAKTHIVVTDDTDGANGSAQIVPFNIIRLFITGPGSLSSLNDYDDWIYGLIVHEYTHILHIDTIHGLARLVNYVFGKTWVPNQIQPAWFIEGLATYYESARTAGGRLRSSVFDMYLRMAVLEGKTLNIDQISSGTRYFPHGNVVYLYGSQFIRYIADRFGEDKLAQISHRYGGTTIPWAINRIAKEVVGHTYVELYEDFKRHLRRRYEFQRETAARRGLTRFRKVTDHGEASDAPVFSRDGRELAFIDTDGHSQTAFKIMDAATGKVTQRFDYFGGSGVDFTPDRRHLVYGASSVWRTFYSYDDLFVRDRVTGVVRRLTSGLRARDPSVSPDGRTVAFVTNDLGATNLALIPFEGGPHRVLFQGRSGDQVFTPRWSPDGKQVVYSHWSLGGYRDIYLMEVATRKTRRLTADRALDTNPVFSADGRRIYFSSDRTGIYNIFCWDRETEQVSQVSNVVGGAFSPAISPDERELYYVGFSAKGYDLHAMSVDRRAFLPALPYRDTRPAPAVVRSTEAYPERAFNPLATLYPRQWMFHYNTDAFGGVAGIDFRGADVVGRHNWAFATSVSTSKGYVSYGLSYAYERFWPSLGLDTGRSVGVRGGVVLDGIRQNYLEENYVGGVGLGLPVLRLPDHSVTLSLGYRVNWFRNADAQTVIVEPGMVSPKFPEVGLLAGATLGATYATLQRYAWSVSNAKGRVLNVGLRMDHPSLGSDFQSTQLTYGWTEFVALPWFFDHVLALRLNGGISSGNLSRRGVFFIGGFPEQDIVRAVLDNTRVGGAFLRGYAPGVVYGDQYHLLNVEYRMPLFNIEKGFSTLPLYFTRVHGAAFADVGHAFFGRLALSDLKVGVGAELLLEAVIGYYVPCTFRIGYARGLMDPGDNEFHFLLGTPF